MRHCLAWLVFVSLCVSSCPTMARDILLIDDFATGFGPAVGLLTGAGHNVTQIFNERAGGYTHLSDASYLSNFDMVVYSVRSRVIPNAAILGVAENYAAQGGDLLLTSLGESISLDDPNDTLAAFQFARLMGPEYVFGTPPVPQQVTTIDNFITHGPFGDFRGAASANSNGYDQFHANTAIGAVPLVSVADGRTDKVVFTDLPGSGGSIGIWQGHQFQAPGLPAQPDFFDGDVFQGLFLNWAQGGTTTQTEITPQVFTTEAHPQASSITLDIYLGNPTTDGVLLASAGPFPVHGTAKVVGSVDGSGDGTVALAEGIAHVDDVNNALLDLGVLGSLRIDVSNTTMFLNSRAVDVLGNQYDITQNYYTAGLLSGSFNVHSPTGAVAALLPGTFPVVLDVPSFYLGGPDDFDGATFDGTFDEGAGLLAPGAEFNLNVDRAGLPLIYLPGLGDLYAVPRSDLHFAAVPEPSSLVLMLAALACGALLPARRKLR
ncbi:MAG: PEP-CTERM sorting domain-containing protein [Pirellulales bacterium]|nr:PEP-CTERM sorting domain-containing protein [Pirellulales bacterium]